MPPTLSHQTTENQQTSVRLSKSFIRALDDAVILTGIQRSAAIFTVVITNFRYWTVLYLLSYVAFQIWDCHRWRVTSKKEVFVM